MTGSPCLKCGADSAELVEVARGMTVVASALVCDRCWELQMVEFRGLQAQFAQLIEAGVDRAAANRIMLERMRGEAAS